MNELVYNFINQIEDVNKVGDITIEEFTKIVKSNKLISEKDAKKLIESFKKISSNKNEDDGSSDSDQRKKKYKQKLGELETKYTNKEEKTLDEKENEENSIER